MDFRLGFGSVFFLKRAWHDFKIGSMVKVVCCIEYSDILKYDNFLTI